MARRILAGLLVAALSLPGIATAEEEPAHTVVLAEDSLELRRYEPMIVAEVRVKSDRDDAISAGFRYLADYIFGGNAPNTEIAMTAPVTQSREGVEIEMTAPVTQSREAEGIWIVRFVMPREWTMATLPKPNDPSVRLIEVPAATRAVITFSGRAARKTLDTQQAELQQWIATKGWTAEGEATYAYYDPPWTLPFLRRNEIMWTVSGPGVNPGVTPGSGG